MMTKGRDEVRGLNIEIKTAIISTAKRHLYHQSPSLSKYVITIKGADYACCHTDNQR